MNLSRDRAEQLALEYVGRDESEHYKLILINVDISKISPKYWAATFEVRTPNGHVIEGPLLILVNDDLGKAMSLDEAVESYILDKEN